MNRLEREVLQELEADYEFDEDRAIAIVALCKEAFETDLRDKQESEDDSFGVPKHDPLEEIINLLGQQQASQINARTGSSYNTVTTQQYAATTTVRIPPTITADQIAQSVNSLRNSSWIHAQVSIEILQAIDVVGSYVYYRCKECGWAGRITLNPNSDLNDFVVEIYKGHAKSQHNATEITVMNTLHYGYKP